jgi:hypothetical protein
MLFPHEQPVTSTDTHLLFLIFHTILFALFGKNRETNKLLFMKNTVFWYVLPSRSCVNRRFGGTYRLHLQGRKIRQRGTSVNAWQQMEAICSFETSVNTRSTRRHIPEDGILHSHRCENLKSYKLLFNSGLFMSSSEII